MKKILILLAVTMFLFSVSGQAMAYFEDGHLIRAVYQVGGQYEVLTDLGAFGPTTPYSGPALSFTEKPFPPAGSGVFSGASWASLQAAYFIKTSSNVWTSGPVDGQLSGNRKFVSFESAANSVYAGAGSYASGTAQATLKQSDLQSYVSWMDLGDPVNSYGYFAGFTPDQDGEQNLAALGTGSGYVDSYLFYYASSNSAASGLQVANIRTYADGHTEIPGSAQVATHFTVTVPASATAGKALNFSVTALDDSDNAVTGYAGTVHFTSSDGSATLPANTKLAGGTGTFPATLKTVGSQIITATDTVTPSITGTSNSVTVNKAVATHFTVSAPAAAITGTTFSFTVTALDAGNSVVADYAGTVHFTSSDGSATLPANSTLTNGTDTFQATLTTAGSRTITATDTASPSLTGISNAIAVGAPATHFTVTAPATATAGKVLNFSVTALDAGDNVVTGYAVTVRFTGSDGSATLPANSTLTNGTGTFQATLMTVGSQTITATDTVTPSITGTSNSVTVNKAVATHFTVSAPAAAIAGTTFSFTVTALDAGNSVIADYAGIVRFTSSDGSATLPANSTLTNGTGTFQATLKTAGNRTITATDTVTSSLTGISNAVAVAAPATHFTVTAPVSATAGTTFSFTVTALDAGNKVAAGYSGTVRFTSSDGSATLPANTTLINGAGTFQATLKTVGSRTITAIDTAPPSIAGISNAIMVGAPATHFTVTAPATVVAGAVFSFKVTALDAGNKVVTNYSGKVHFTSTDGSATLPVNTTLANGAGTFEATSRKAGSWTITAADTAASSLTGTSALFVTGAAAATDLTVSAPASAVAGTAFSFTATALDQFSNIAKGYTHTVRFNSTDESATLPASARLTNGVGTFQATLKAAGGQTITAFDSITPSTIGTSGVITTRAAAVTQYKVSAPASAVAGTAFTFTVTALDQLNNIVKNCAHTVLFASTDGGATLPSNARLTNGAGTFQATLKTTGSQSITATYTAVPYITGTSEAIVAGAAAATHFTVSAPATATVGTAFSFTVTALDQFNNVATGYAHTVHFTSTDGSAILPANTTLAKGTGAFEATLRKVGKKTITAADTTAPSLTATSKAIVTGPTVATHFKLSAPALAVAGTAFSFTVTALDQFNNRATGYAHTVRFTSNDESAALPASTKLINGAGTFQATLKTAGSRTITTIDTTATSITGSSKAIVTGPAAATHLTVSAPASATAGKTFNFTATALDQFNNIATGYAHAVRFTSSDGRAVLSANTILAKGKGTIPATLKTAGSQTITATDTIVRYINGTSKAIVVE